MRSLLLSSLAVAVCVPVAAQQDHFSTSPPGYENVEGSTSNDLIGREATLRFQQVVSGHYAAMGNRDSMAFRRDGLLPDNVAYGARTVEMELTLAESSLGGFGSDFNANLGGSNTTVVVTKKNVSFDDYTIAPPPGTTAGHSACICFDSGVLWSKAAGSDWTFEIKVYSNTKGGQPYPMDTDAFTQTCTLGQVATLSGGCTVPGQTSPFDHDLGLQNCGNQIDLGLMIRRGVVGAPAALLIDTTAANLNLGLCNPVNVAGGLILGLTLDANGGYTQAASIAGLNIPGVQLHSQAACADASQPGGIAISDGITTTVPANPSNQSQVKHAYALSPTATTATSVVNGGVVVFSNHP